MYTIFKAKEAVALRRFTATERKGLDLVVHKFSDRSTLERLHVLITTKLSGSLSILYWEFVFSIQKKKKQILNRICILVHYNYQIKAYLIRHVEYRVLILWREMYGLNFSF